MRYAITPEQFFSRKVITAPGRWEFTGAKHQYGYGWLTYKQKGWCAHRLAWLFTHGEIPAGYNVLHRCDNPPCFNPAHLFLGTQRENLRDMKVKGRHRPCTGEACGTAKLTEAQVRKIRDLASRRYRQADLAAHFGVSKTSISSIVRGKSWRSLNP